MLRPRLTVALLMGLSVALSASMDDPLSGRASPVHQEAPTLSEAEVTRLIATARSEVLLEMSVFDDRAIAEGYRVAVAERGAKGYILTRADTAEIGASYLPWASILSGTGARLLAYTRGDYVVVDRRVAVIREQRMGLPVYRLEENPKRVAALVRQFVEAYRVARPYSVEGLVRRAAQKYLR
ncbi:hypothetical protein Mesil_0510 [Allomeiothermus silvanus DSM 9946]|uniref:TPM domain-containing protein n=1 Tax=Allomeiothermus silvanus (strain ATCC 700542 / DSM 9946 / NBRC 106475 / NCIMB 13440 / VI-R2) TaxID=526227 RepID=D7BA09_ALLS1|nr:MULTISPECIES: hypothetical protein [Thermaceae]ADH62443.1 hypothetical protein Mesil_0510 [Allomeiothermus silvanus DSM 9946]